MRLTIVGAGMAGLLAANLLHRHRPVVVEAQPSLPNNHAAVLRFRSDAVGQAVGVPFRRVLVRKASVPWRNPVADSLAYAMKNTGTYASDRSIGGADLVERHVAPPDLIERMAVAVGIRFGQRYDFSRRERDEVVISTIPMPQLMEVLDYPGPRPEFRHRHGSVLSFRVRRCDAFASLYVPDPEVPFSRISVTGDLVMVEFPGDVEYHSEAAHAELARWASRLIGVNRDHVVEETIEVKEQRYAKIEPIDERVRRDFMHWCSTLNNHAYSLGRFATWRPGLLLDDLVKDVRTIETWMTNPSSGYARDLHLAEKRRSA
jgi:hypothetical protein